MNILKKSVLACALLATTGIASFAQTAEEIVQKHLTAIGGEDAWKKVNSIKYTGAISTQGMEIPVVMTVVNNKAMRVDYKVLGTDNYNIVTTKEGWNYSPAGQMQKAEPMTPEQVKMQQDQLDIQGDLVDYKKKGATIESLGKDDMEGTEAYKLKYTTKDGREKMMYFDANSYYLLKQTEKMTVDGKEEESETMFSDYQKQPSGIVVAMAIDSQMGPLKFSSVDVNPKTDDAMFKPSN